MILEEIEKRWCIMNAIHPDDTTWLIQRVKMLEELTKGMGSDQTLAEALYEYHERVEKAEARVKELEAQVTNADEWEEVRSKLLIEREDHIKTLEEGIDKHKRTMKPSGVDWDEDRELYKLINK